MNIITNNQRYKTNSDFLLRKIAGEAVLIPVGDASHHLNGMLTFNESFQFIWEHFKEPHTVEEVVATARLEYEDPDGTIEKDIRNFVEESLKYGFICKEED